MISITTEIAILLGDQPVPKFARHSSGRPPRGLGSVESKLVGRARANVAEGLGLIVPFREANCQQRQEGGFGGIISKFYFGKEGFLFVGCELPRRISLVESWRGVVK